jgi:hypothetical protein
MVSLGTYHVKLGLAFTYWREKDTSFQDVTSTDMGALFWDVEEHRRGHLFEMQMRTDVNFDGSLAINIYMCPALKLFCFYIKKTSEVILLIWVN